MNEQEFDALAQTLTDTANSWMSDLKKLVVKWSDKAAEDNLPFPVFTPTVELVFVEMSKILNDYDWESKLK